MKNSFFIIVLTLTIFNIKSQDLLPGLKFWGTVGIDWRMTEKFSMKISQINGLNLSAGKKFEFTRSDVQLLFRPNQLLQIGFGYKPGIYNRNSGTKFYSRIYTSAILRHNLFKLPLKHTITAEMFLPAIPKFQYRFVYSFSYFFKNNKLPFGITPFIKGDLYYYLSGSNNSYYDDLNNLAVKQAPNDFHRFRIGAGITSKPFPMVRATAYYMYQKEFNTNLTTYRDLNMLNHSQTKINDPFNNFGVIGFELDFILRSNERTKTSKKVESDTNQN